MKFRYDSMDLQIAEEINNRQVYPLPQSFDGQVVVDIGAHVGFFSARAAQMGAKAVYSFEAHPENFAFLEQNMKQYDQVKVYNRPVWRSDEKEILGLDDSGFLLNSGISHVQQGGNFELESIGLDEILKIVKEDGHDCIDYLKLDCEGSEFPILYSCSCMDSIGTIAAEIHPAACEYMNMGDLSYEPSSQGIRDFLIEHSYRRTAILVTRYCSVTPLDMLYAIR